METKDIFAPEFKTNPELTKDVLNELIETNHVLKKDMYKSGTFLYLEVSENAETLKILSKVISDIEGYKQYNNESFISNEKTEIGLCALQDEHRKLFYNDGKEIKWDDRFGEFVFEDDLI